MKEARTIAEETARASYGRLMAWLAARTSDVAAAEDALADAFRAALEHWPEKGVPEAPEAWLLTTAKRKLIDGARRAQTRHAATPALLLASEEADEAMRAHTPFPDERLKLLFICAHPAIDITIHTPLMLQTVLGLDAARIASAFLTSPAAMSGRLVRAKRKIKAAGIPFTTPDTTELPARLSAVLEAIYAAFGAGWDNIDGAENETNDLTQEAIYLARLIALLLPNKAETHGLLALMLYAEARKPARRIDDRYIPLAEQNTSLWDKEMISEAELTLARAWRLKEEGSYQIEAAIQSAHVASKLFNRETHTEIVTLYAKLIELAPTTGAIVGYAAALAAALEPASGLAVLEKIDAKQAARYQPYWAVKAHLLKESGDVENARKCYERAIGLSEDDATRGFLHTQLNMLELTVA